VPPRGPPETALRWRFFSVKIVDLDLQETLHLYVLIHSPHA
jgi:hypothetical protein